MRRWSLFVVLVMVASIFALSVPFVSDVQAATLFVGGGGPGNHTTIQAAVDIANPGDTVFVYSGTYYENVTIEKPISLVGEDSNTTTIDGFGADAAVLILADWVNVSGFRLTNSGSPSHFPHFVGVRLNYVEDCHVFENNMTENHIGVSIGHSDNNVIERNNVSDNGAIGFSIAYSDNVEISENLVTFNRYEGILLRDSEYTNLTGNIIASNGQEGLSLEGSRYARLSGNRFYSDGIGILGGDVSEWNSHSMDTSNKVNDDPLLYLKDVVNGTVPLGAGQVILANCRNATVEGQVISHADNAILVGFSYETIIAGNAVSSNGLMGISLYASDGSHISNNTANDNTGGIEVFSSDFVIVERNVAPNNYFWGIHLVQADQALVLDNDASNNVLCGIAIYRSINVSFFDNSMSEDGICMEGDAVEYFNSHVIDTSNTVNAKPVYYWKNVDGGAIPAGAGQVILANASGITVVDQNVSNGSYGIILAFSSNNTIAHNIAVASTITSIFAIASDDNLMEYNDASFNARGYGTGIGLQASSRNALLGNDVIDNGHGIHIQTALVGVPSEHNLVDSNNISMNCHAGIELRASNNTIVRNNISSNSKGIETFGLDNRIYHNSFLSNNKQAVDYTANGNEWDDGYPSGGNYWSDYGGVDNKWGVNQDFPGSDGIGDTPYIIDADSRDRYPLMSPFEPPTRPPTASDAVLSGANFENVTIRWDLSPDDGAGYYSVVEYEIWRGSTYDRRGLGYIPIATLINRTTAFIDSFAGEGDPENYFYLICAIDRNNHTVCAEEQAGKFTRPLSSGPNLISIPLIQSDEYIGTVLQTVKYDKAWFYDPSSEEWKWHMTFKTYRRGLWNINHTMGLWVNATEECNLTVAGIVPAQTTIHLFKGWNLIGYPSFNISYAVGDLKAELPVERVEGFDPTAPPHFLRVLQDSDVLLAGEGYWVKVSQDATWVVSNG